jgi:hypothetical protein
MAQFCTKCGTACDGEALFCDNCGAALRARAVATPPIAASAAQAVSGAARAPMRMPTRRTIGLIGAALAVSVVGAVALVQVLAPEPASSASFTRAVNEYFAKDPAASERLVCVGNLPYQTNPMRVAEYDRGTREWMELLSAAGVYAAATMESSGSGFFARNQVVYQMTDRGRAAVRSGKLCVAGAVQASAASGFEHVQRDAGQSRAMAHATLTLKEEAPWLAKAPQRADILRRLGMEALGVDLPLSLVDKKWRVYSGAQAAQGMRRQRDGDPFGAAGVGAMRAAGASVASPGLFERLRSMLSFGGHPLVGKWSDSSGMANFEFTRDSMVQNGVSSPASFKVTDDAVIVTPAGVGVGLKFKVQDANHVALDAGFMRIVLTRSQ